MIRSENIFLPVSPVTPNHITQKGFPAKFCSIFALSARICRFRTAAFELEYFCLSARICRFWRSFYAESDIPGKFTEGWTDFTSKGGNVH